MTDQAPDELDLLRRRVAELELAIEEQRAQHRVEREHDRLRHQEHALGLIIEAEAAQQKNHLLTKRINRLKKRVEELQRASRRQHDASSELAQVYSSRTWRLGRALTRPARARRS